MNAKFNNKPYKEESLKTSSDSISIEVNTITGKEGDFWICISPSLNVSGYGRTIEEAKKSFEENIIIFCDDIQSLKSEKKHQILVSLGWKQKKYAKKQFSKAFVDKDGILQNLEHAIVSLETVA